MLGNQGPYWKTVQSQRVRNNKTVPSTGKMLLSTLKVRLLRDTIFSYLLTAA